MELEKKRGISISSTVLQFDYNGYRLNLLDTPRHKDFSEDILATIKSSVLTHNAAAKAAKATKPRKLSFKEARDLEGMEAQILAAEAEIVRIEGLFASPDFHRTHATLTNQLNDDLATAKANLAQLFARWEELEAINTASWK